MTSRSCVSHSIPPITVTRVSKHSQLFTWHTVFHHRSCRVQARCPILQTSPAAVYHCQPCHAYHITSTSQVSFFFFSSYIYRITSLRRSTFMQPPSHASEHFCYSAKKLHTRSRFPTCIVRRSGHSCAHAIRSTHST